MGKDLSFYVCLFIWNSLFDLNAFPRIDRKGQLNRKQSESIALNSEAAQFSLYIETGSYR